MAELSEALRRAKLRIARPTDNMASVVDFYRRGLGFMQLAAFEDHVGFDGVILGAPGLPYHLEFTHRRGHRVGLAPTEDNLLVFYLPDRPAWQAAVDRLGDLGAKAVASYNPYWDVQGKTFADPDGYRVVLQNADWPL